MKLIKLCMACVILTTIVGSTAQADEFMYALSSYTNGNLLKIEPTTWAVIESHPITNDEALFGGLAADAAKDIYSIDGYNDENLDRTFRIDRANGAGTVVGDTGFNWNFRFLCAHPVTDVLYGGRDNALFTIDRTTGAATLVGNMTGVGGQITALAIDSQGNAYCTSLGNTSLYSLDLATVEATHIGDIGSGSGYQDLAFDSNDVLYGVHFFDAGTLYTIDTVNATETFVVSTSYRGITFIVEGPECPGDIDGDTDLADLATLLGAYGTSVGDPQYNPDADFDDSGSVDLSDLAFLLADYGCTS